MSVLCAVDGCRSTGRHLTECQDVACRGCHPRRAEPGLAICLTCEQRAWDACQAIARLWPETEAALTRSSRRGEPVKASREPGLDLDPHAVEHRAIVRTTVLVWARTLLEVAPSLDGRDALKGARVRLEHAIRTDRDDVRPARIGYKRAKAYVRHLESCEVDWLASWLGTNLRHLTRHNDQREAVAFVEEVTRDARVLRSLAEPLGARKYAPGIPCVEHLTDAMGQRVPCGGSYEARVWDGMGVVPDLRCTVDGTHILTPAGFRRLGRALNKGAVEALAEAISRVG